MKSESIETGKLIVTDFPKIKKHLVGMVIPKRHHGNIGRLVEAEIESLGYEFNRGAGPDLEGFGVEIKTRGNNTDSANSIASSTLQNIINTPYAKSLVFKKMQKQLRVKFCDKDHRILTVELFNFDRPEIQEILEKEYEALRQIIIKNNRQDYYTFEVIRTDKKLSWAHWEVTDSGQFKFRIPDKRMLQLESMSEQVPNLFEYI